MSTLWACSSSRNVASRSSSPVYPEEKLATYLSVGTCGFLPGQHGKQPAVRPPKRADDTAAQASASAPEDQLSPIPEEGSEKEQSNAAQRQRDVPKHSEQEIQEFRFARRVFQALQMAIERWRLRNVASLDEREGQSITGLAELYELLLSDDNNPSIHWLSKLPRRWWRDAGPLSDKIDTTRQASEDSTRLRAALDECQALYDTAVSKRGDSFVGVGGASQWTPEARQAARQAVRKARSALLNARMAYRHAQQRSEGAEKRSWRMVDHILTTAEKAMISEGYLHPWGGDRSVSAGSNGQGDEQPGGNQDLFSEHSYYKSRRTSEAQPPHSPPRKEAAEQVHERILAQRENKTAPQRWDARSYQSGGSEVTNVVQGTQSQQCRDALEARAAYERAVRKFNRVRDEYYGDLAAFVEKSRKGAIRGTRTEFDHAYYLARGKANIDVAATRYQLDFAIEQAERTRPVQPDGREALAREDVAVTGVEITQQVWQLVRELNNEREELWLDGQNDFLSESQWQTMRPLSSNEGVTLRSVGGVEEEERVASGRLRKLIYQWQREQRKIRRKIPFATVPSMVPKGAELKWFEEWSGL